MITFFEPHDAFLAWLKEHAAGRLVWDVGCGNGAFLRRLLRSGIPAVGVEPLPEWTGLDRKRDLCASYFPQTAEECRALHRWENGLVLVLRPSHGDVEARVTAAHPSSEVLVALRPGRAVHDLPLLSSAGRLERVEAPGLREEVLWRVRPESREGSAALQAAPEKGVTAHGGRPVVPPLCQRPVPGLPGAVAL